MKMRNGELESWFSHKFQVVTNLYFQWADFKADKLQFKKFQTISNLVWKNNFEHYFLSFGVNKVLVFPAIGFTQASHCCNFGKKCKTYMSTRFFDCCELSRQVMIWIA